MVVESVGQIEDFHLFSLLDKTTEHLKQNEILWRKRKERYIGENDYCNENFLYNKDSDFLKKAKCKCYNCESCRPKKKYDLLRNIIDSAEKYNLKRHFIITLPGYPFRSNFCNVDESFDYAMKKFNEFRVLYKRRFGKNLSYICLQRSQEDGFCHLHILVGDFIPKEWLDDVLKRINLGFSFIRYVDVQRLGNYLSKYWYKEHEWFIPENKKHYTRSADIDLDFFRPYPFWYFIGVPNSLYSSGSDILDCVYRCMDWINPFHNPPPFEFMLEIFYKELHKEFESDYVSFLIKHGVKSPIGLTESKVPNYLISKQMRLYYTGRSYCVTIGDFNIPKYTRQKKFKRDEKWKPMYKGEKYEI
jgi:hypothetical protein